MKTYKYAYVSIGCLAFLLVLFALTDPNNIPVGMFAFVFIAFYGFFAATSTLIGLLVLKTRLIGWSHRRLRRAAMLVAVFPVLLLCLQSVDQLTLRDLMLAASLFVVSYLYFSRLTAEAPKSG